MTGRQKVNVRIKSHGMLTCFGYGGLRTPAIVELYEHQLAVLQQQGVDYEIITQPPVTTRTRKKVKETKEETE